MGCGRLDAQWRTLTDATTADVHTAALTGLRRTELMALTAGSIEIENDGTPMYGNVVWMGALMLLVATVILIRRERLKWLIHQ